MTLFTQIKTDQLTARKAKDTLAANLLTTLIGEVSALAKNDGNREVTDADVVKICKKFVTGMEQTVTYLGNSNPEGTTTALAEMEILEKYMPKQMDEDTLTEVLCELVPESGPNLGKLMALLKERYAGQYDGKMAAIIAKTVL